jgi:hypothetical protein
MSPFHQRVARTTRAGVQLKFQVGVMACRLRHCFRCFGRQNGPTEIGVQDDPRAVDHRAKAGSGQVTQRGDAGVGHFLPRDGCALPTPQRLAQGSDRFLDDARGVGAVDSPNLARPDDRRIRQYLVNGRKRPQAFV